MESSLTHDFESVKFWTNNGILFCQFTGNNTNCTLNEKNAAKYIDAVKEVTQGKPMPFLVDIRNSVGNFSIPAAKLIASSPILKKIRISEAFIVNSINGKILIFSYKRIFEPKTPSRVFNNMKDALQFCEDTKKDFLCKPQ
ncbi:hypothetical protein CLV33_105262 [Jejuia pallidilutea]|uniref:DUF7793 domain-containing protein n=1 Tax=Jejuia pallidilutea TaxID=504487 RepID=A0A362X3C2_9FLAO|nr:hypothetical protein [Jejuia pallidilutea]PQV48403.1 hypothetical protein CLV33_105262 [Jejuia pallidilutea]